MPDLPHRRRNLLSGEWVLVSPHRVLRPWQGDEDEIGERSVSHDPRCYLCPGNARAGGQRNPRYQSTFVFPNDFPALLDSSIQARTDGVFTSAPATGEAQVICYSPDHAATLASLDDDALGEVVATWTRLSAELGNKWAHVQIFENKGAMMGCSSPHPHGQVWAGDFLPSEVEREDHQQREWLAANGRPLLDMLVEAELCAGDRIVEENDGWLAIVPYWASWPFEILLLARGGIARLEDMNEAQGTSLARILKRLLARYDALFETSFPYSMGWHGAPHALAGDTAHWQLHAHFYPPLLRSAQVRKFMVGFELLAEAQRDLTPEAAAKTLRDMKI